MRKFSYFCREVPWVEHVLANPLKLKSYGLRRKSVNADEDLVRRRIRQELEGPGCRSKNFPG